VHGFYTGSARESAHFRLVLGTQKTLKTFLALTNTRFTNAFDLAGFIIIWKT